MSLDELEKALSDVFNELNVRPREILIATQQWKRLFIGISHILNSTTGDLVRLTHSNEVAPNFIILLSL